ncbi:uncharacterized protein N0V89_000763 [Didymosphaeria variabile]|uniref:Cytochrome P450 n=1 Tax=Didymosphaeria variabile TaxID=1932322 RepID=A0A9W8XVT9_9PLEO|nr:uncharacterized protein N0V89_000763 [Didymosphaeria variabile]KAJ4360203.1 hypothetical protein N0V89_000763 [Didymosphaeria variabile]
MPQSTLSRLLAANIPWTLHIAALLTSIWFLSPASRSIFLLFYGLTTFLFDTECLLAALQNADEPPLIPHLYLPYVGHVIGMFWHGASYFARVNASTQYPMYTLLTLTGRTIVVIDPALAGTIQKASKNTSFYGMILEVTKRLVDLDEPTMEIIRWNISGEHGPHEGLMHEAGSMVARELSPGPSLNEMSAVQLQQFSMLLNAFVPGSTGVEISLMDFVKRIFTVGNAFTIYGPQNPFALNPSLVQDFWTWEQGMIAVMADIFPSLTARKPYLARKAINAALEEFVAKEHYRNASPMIQKRVQINLKHGLTTKMAGHAELILLFGVTGNVVPTTFWVLANIFSRPELLARIREETSQAVLCMRSAPVGPREKVINVAQLKTKCPLLVSTYRETIRSIANLSSVRLVMHTHTVSAPGHRPYLLRQGGIVQIASGVIHALDSVWGSDANKFNPSRFMSATTTNEQFSASSSATEITATALPKGVSSAAYRGFGGGSVICPGRHFAQNEILGFVALCVHMLDIVDVKTGGSFALPVKDDGRIPLSVMKPAREPQVLIKRREGEESAAWSLEL